MMLWSATVALLGLFTTLQVEATSHRPDLRVPACPRKATASFDKTLPDNKPFPKTSVDLCYTNSALKLVFTATGESKYYVDEKQGTNDEIWRYEVMEAFISRGSEDPATYLEFEINPKNVTYQAFVYNPTRVRAENAPFDHFFVSDPIGDGLVAKTTTDAAKKLWVSDVTIPLALFNAESDVFRLRGSQWRMNFFRTITNETLYPDQILGAWKSPGKASFHITPAFGHITFI
ncbi:hypothetical protein H4219_001660 [Mycoemilia scoparia]|uniref:Carbohydrate-binding domain-containing protein n=1 Tax=Mycoemilia scoparia TaxID=417184 RepID=A0A9W7ZZQ5_9FUNG|nr:hypothetical protein H4219_001660 [Mycoemilia scoparia]